jgi:acetoacetyl-CoA synthetase
MVVLKEVHEDLIAPVKEFLARQPDFGLSNHWEPVFEYPWKLAEFPYGYAILDDGKIAGFLGTMYSRRIVEGKNVIFCNMTSWIMDAEYRAMKIGNKLLDAILESEQLLITNLTPSGSHRKSYEKKGFQVLEQEQISIPIFPRFTTTINGAKNGDRLVTFDIEEIQTSLDESDRKILDDHKGLPCVHFLIRRRDSSGYCYGLATTSAVHKLNFIRAKLLNVCYLSDPALFVQSLNLVKKKFWALGRFVFLRYDSRLITRRLSRLEFKNQGLRLFRSNGIAAPHVDNIYSELITFNKF